MPTTDLVHGTVALDSPGDTPQSRIDAALRILTLHTSGDTLTLTHDLLTVLDPPSELSHTDALPSCPPSEVLEERVADHLATCWPRLAYGDFSTELARDAMAVITPVADQLQEAARSWRQRATCALTDRDRARDLAVTLEQAGAEAVRLLRAGRPGEALAVLESDAHPYADPSHASRESPVRLFVVAEHGFGQPLFSELDLEAVDVAEANECAHGAAPSGSTRPSTQTTDTRHGTETFASDPKDQFTGAVTVVALALVPYLADVKEEVRHEEAGESYDADHGKDLDDDSDGVRES